MGDSSLLLLFLCSIATLLVAIIRFGLNPFLALLGTSLLTGLLAGLAPEVVAKQLATGFGQTLSGIGIVIGLGIIFGTLLAHARATEQIAALLLRRVGSRRSALAVNLTGYFASIPVFFDAAFVIFMPLLRDLSRSTRLPLAGFITALAVGLISTHCLVIPTPGPLAVMGTLGVEAGAFLGLGVVVALPASLVGGWLMAQWVGRTVSLHTDPVPVPPPDPALAASPLLPSGRRSLAVLLFPIGLILLGSLSGQALSGASPLRPWLALLGDKNVAMLLGIAVAAVALRPYFRQSFESLVVEGAAAAGLILLITGAGGAFGSIISASGIGGYLVRQLSSLQIPLLALGFVLAALLRGAQGSATVALVTTASIVAPLIGPLGATPTTVALGICCGGMCCSFPNDSGFWVVSRFGGLNVPQTLRAWTLASSIGGLTGLAVTGLIDWLVY